MPRESIPLWLSRVLHKQFRGSHEGRAFHTARRRLAAHGFDMPAMSPTMTEGNISAWKVQEGDSFSTGDVLLEIETDKAQMDVEAQDDGVMAKIVQPDGSKGVKVGTRIAITGDPEDNVETLDLSTVASANSTPVYRETKSDSNSNSKAPESQDRFADTKAKNQDSLTSATSKVGRDTQYPLFPSVIQLLHERGISTQEADSIPATGPKGRLLKGDILAYVGTIDTSYSQNLSKRIERLSRLDLSNIEFRPQSEPAPGPKDPTDKSVTETSDELRPLNTKNEVALPISLSAVRKVRERVHNALGIDISVQTFIARATQLCNDDLPVSKRAQISSEDLFNAVLGLDSVPKPGMTLVPHIQAFEVSESTKTIRPSKPNVIDELAAEYPSRLCPTSVRTVVTTVDPNVSLFSVSVPIGDEQRGKIFLERLKTVLQLEPGRLVL